MLTITTTHQPATDLGYLLHKHPDRMQTFDVNFGKAHVFYPEATNERCTAALTLDIDPIDLTRRGRKSGSTPEFLLQDYVNDRPYTASSHLSVAIAKVFGTALSGTCKDRPDLPSTPIPLEAKIASVHSRYGKELIERLFQPLGYQIDIETLPMDNAFPAWGDGHHHNLTLRTEDKTLRDLLVHLYVLLPAMDNKKHYWINQDEIQKLLRFGEGWLDNHPARHTISRRYLGNRRNLFDQAQEQFAERAEPQEEEEERETPEQQTNVRTTRNPEPELERRMSLQELRIQAVMQELHQSGAKSILDLGCGEGHLLRELVKDKNFTSITGLEVSLRTLEIAKRRLKLNDMTPDTRAKVHMMHGSLIYRDDRLKNTDAAVAMEVVEHIDPPKLDSFEDAVMEAAKPRTLIVTTPNREYNVLFTDMNTTFRHRDHRFEWTRGEFKEWAEAAAGRRGYDVVLKGIGQEHPVHGPPTQMAVFTKSKGKTPE